jgi:hypothetical protein
MRMQPITTLVAAVLAALSATPASAVTLGQIDTFSSGTQGWGAGGGPGGSTPPTPPQVIADGGPGGAGDSFLRVVSTGSGGPGGRLVAMNVLGQWAGDYIAAGVTGIAMDVRNAGTTDITLRLYFEDPIPGPPANEAVSTQGVLLPAGGGWQSVLLPIGAGDMTALTGTHAGALSGTTVLRLFHASTATFPGEAMAAVLDVDNIQAVPEPAAWALWLAGAAGLGLLRRRRAR